VLIFNVPNVTL